jgi:hypothetical protein
VVLLSKFPLALLLANTTDRQNASKSPRSARG